MQPPAQRFDRFTTLQILGRGGMGIVYLARDEKLGRQVALKVLSEGNLTDERRGLFLREARAAAAIRHPNVATIYEVGEREDGLPYIAMEYCQGETLAEVVKKSGVEASMFLPIATQIAEGVAAAHRNGVLHRDLKSANIMIEAGGIVKILDFGLAKLIEPEAPAFNPGADSVTGNFFGTIHYLSPEQARGVTADARSDLFSIGIVLYEMATGHLPFSGESPLAILERIRSSEPDEFQPRDPALPGSVAPIIGKLLQKERDDRYQDAASLVRDLARLQRDSATSAATTSIRASLGATTTRRTGVNVMKRGVAVAVVALAIGAAFVWKIGLDPKPAQAPQKELTRIQALAVLPFRNLSENRKDEFLSVGLADSLVTRLQQIPSLQIRPTSAILAFQGTETNVREASEQLKVDGIVEGHYIADGTRVRVNLQLTDTRTGYGVWAGSVDGRRDDLMQLMDDVSSKTTAALNERLGIRTGAAVSEPRSDNPEAFEAFLKARSMRGSLRPADSQSQIALLRDATRLDPRFAAAHADLAIALSLGQIRGFGGGNQNRTAEWHARQAVRLDPNLPQAHLALGRTLVRFPDRFRESARENLAALRLKPNDPQALYTLIAYLISAGELQRAACIQDRLISLDPSSNEVKARGYWNVNSVDAEGMINSAHWALESKETALAGYDIQTQGFLLMGRREEAVRAQQSAAALVPAHYIEKSLKAMIAAYDSDRTAVDEIVASMKKDVETNHWAALRVALCYGKLGDRAEATRWVKAAAEQGNHTWYLMVKHPWLQSIQGEPEFQKVIAKLKMDLDDVRDDVIGVYEQICTRDQVPQGR